MDYIFGSQQEETTTVSTDDDDEEDNVTLEQLVAFVFVGFIVIGVVITLWNYFWPKVKGFWSYMIPFTIAYTLLRLIELTIQKKLISITIFLVKPLLKILCENTPNLVSDYYCIIFNNNSTTTSLF